MKNFMLFLMLFVISCATESAVLRYSITLDASQNEAAWSRARSYLTNKGIFIKGDRYSIYGQSPFLSNETFHLTREISPNGKTIIRIASILHVSRDIVGIDQEIKKNALYDKDYLLNILNYIQTGDDLHDLDIPDEVMKLKERKTKMEMRGTKNSGL